jgi:VWFA-related protein
MRAFRKKTSKIAILLLVCFSSALAQDPGSKEEVLKPDGTIKVDTSLVLVDGIVINRKTNAIVHDLKLEDFIILENGKHQEITHFSREELPLSLVLLIDVSGSVRPIIEEIGKAALNALAQLKPTDRVAMMIFANRAKLITELTTDRDQIAQQLNRIWNVTDEVGSGTVIPLGVLEAAHYLRERTVSSERRALVLITDDEDFGTSATPREDVLKELYRDSTTLCGIVVSHRTAGRTAINIGTTAAMTAVNPIWGGLVIGRKVMRKVAAPGSTTRFFSEHTGGLTIGAKNGEVGRVFVDLMQMLRTRYTFGYEPPEKPVDGQMRAIKLAVKDKVQKLKGDLQIFARRGYYLNRKKVVENTPVRNQP